MLPSSASADDAVAVTTSDTADNCYSALYVVATGTLSIETLKGVTLSLGSPPAGTTIWIKTRKVRATGTTAVVVGML